MRKIDVAGWCHERDRRWPSYGAQAEHDPWPQTHVFLRQGSRLAVWAAVRGVGGGSQQATFRNELEHRLGAAWLACEAKGWPGALVDQAREYEAEVQHQFVSSTEPHFAHHFGASWIVAITDGVTATLVSLENNRGFLVRGGVATQVTEDRSLFTVAEKPEPWMKDISLGQLGALANPAGERNYVGAKATVQFQTGDVLVLVMGVSPDVCTAFEVTQTLAAPSATAEDAAHRLYERLRASTERLDAKAHDRFLSRAVVIVAHLEE